MVLYDIWELEALIQFEILLAAVLIMTIIIHFTIKILGGDLLAKIGGIFRFSQWGGKA